MSVRRIKENIYAICTLDWSRRLFDEIIPLPQGTSYNSYIVMGNEKTALIDTVDPKKEEELFQSLSEIGVENIDYIIANHGEQDHSGSIPKVLERYPNAKVVTNQKCKEILTALLHIQENKFIIVKDGDTLSLGDKNLEFIIAPWVHWPDTMLTFLKEDKILFTCDLFGSHLATTDLFVTDKNLVYTSAKRYYSEIMMPFRNNIKSHMEKIKKYKIKIIAPSHGPLYNEPDFILDAYRDWISDKVKNEVIIAFVSMHGSTKAMVDHLVNEFIKRDIPTRVFNLTTTDIGELAISLVDASTLVLATPTFLIGAHPSIVYAAYLINALRPKLRYVAIMSSYGWGGKPVEQIKDLLKNINAEFLEPIVTKGLPKKKDLETINKLADEIEKIHK
ncbi:MAG: FprA family A-type flavoprotein, partial [Thermoplasmata archaeon]